jgi:diguanylate cyclase (GGDEF)-like protein/PAS domain S-box-containing protein
MCGIRARRWLASGKRNIQRTIRHFSSARAWPYSRARPVSNSIGQPRQKRPSERARSGALDSAEVTHAAPDAALLRSIIDSMDDALVVFATDGRVILANQAAQRSRPLAVMQTASSLAGYGLFGPDGVTPLPPESTPGMRALAGETVRDVEVVSRLPGQQEQSFRVNSWPIYDSTGAISAAVSVGRENTKARQARQALLDSEALFRTIIRHLPHGAVLIFDRDLRYLMADGDALFASIGFSSQMLVGKVLAEVAAPEHLESLELRYRAALAGETQNFEMARGENTYAINIVPMKDARGEVNAGMTLVYDITSHKRTESALLEQTLLANEEAASVELLQTIAAASNSAQTAHEAFLICLDRVCAFMAWPLGHVYVKKEAVLQSSGWWHDDGSERFANFREQTAALAFGPDDDMIGWVFGSGLATWLKELDNESAFLRARSAREAGIRSGFAFPVLIGDEVVAVLEFYSERSEEPDLRLLSLMANVGTQLGRVVERERARQVNEQRAEEIRNLSIRDELTGLYNRRGFLELARHVLKLADRSRGSALLFFFDLNGMKQINDQLGHEEGDRALCETADVLRATFRASDVVGRLGGDEFVALLPDANATQLERFASRIESELSSRNGNGDRSYRLSASTGGTVYDPSQPESIEALLVKADALMYEQKRSRKLCHAPS